MIDRPGLVEALDDRLGPLGLLSIPAEPGALVREPIHMIRIHSSFIAERVVVHGVHYNRRVILGHAHIELCVPGVAVSLVRVGRVPVVVAIMRLGERDQHTHLIRGSQNLLETQV